MLWVFVSLLVIAAGAAYGLVTRRSKKPDSAPRPRAATGRFGGVEIRVRNGACDAARALEGQRFLAKDAPALPLSTCNAAQCSCSFGKLSDRRTEERRIEHGGLSATIFLAINRRARRERRRARKP